MVRVKIDQKTGGSLFVVEPNQSLSRERLLLTFGLIATTCFAIAFAFAAKGFWPVLPFAGLEVALVGYGFYYTYNRCSTIEVIRLSEDILYIEKGRFRPEQQHKFITAWVRIRHQLGIGHYPSRLLIGSHGKEIEVGAELTEDDRKSLATQLKHQLAVYRRH